MIISVDEEKAFKNVQQQFFKKIIKLGIKGNFEKSTEASTTATVSTIIKRK